MRDTRHNQEQDSELSPWHSPKVFPQSNQAAECSEISFRMLGGGSARASSSEGPWSEATAGGSAEGRHREGMN